jgi:hypothetical protein
MNLTLRQWPWTKVGSSWREPVFVVRHGKPDEESRFGCVRFLVWAVIFEALLVIVGLVCWRLFW